mmetsp:Transcript_6008/g.13261  ORF Transcript_6008/g.13261 Transcript_6008/m.13261 type:complete len:317 (+) Transcript_6008:1407-2357(+)
MAAKALLVAQTCNTSLLSLCLTLKLLPPALAAPQVITLPSPLKAAKADRVEDTLCTLHDNCSLTISQLPPDSWSPHVMIDPFCFRAAKDLSLEYMPITPSAMSLLTALLSPPEAGCPQVVTPPPSLTAAKANAVENNRVKVVKTATRVSPSTTPELRNVDALSSMPPLTLASLDGLLPTEASTNMNKAEAELLTSKAARSTTASPLGSTTERCILFGAEGEDIGDAAVDATAGVDEAGSRKLGATCGCEGNAEVLITLSDGITGSFDPSSTGFGPCRHLTSTPCLGGRFTGGAAFSSSSFFSFAISSSIWQKTIPR